MSEKTQFLIWVPCIVLLLCVSNEGHAESLPKPKGPGSPQHSYVVNTVGEYRVESCRAFKNEMESSVVSVFRKEHYMLRHIKCQEASPLSWVRVVLLAEPHTPAQAPSFERLVAKMQVIDKVRARRFRQVPLHFKRVDRIASLNYVQLFDRQGKEVFRSEFTKEYRGTVSLVNDLYRESAIFGERSMQNLLHYFSRLLKPEPFSVFLDTVANVEKVYTRYEPTIAAEGGTYVTLPVNYNNTRRCSHPATPCNQGDESEG